jgi:hypothetical protein
VIEEDGIVNGISFSISSSMTNRALTLHAVSGNASLVPDENLQVSYASGAGILNVTPLPERSGLAVITLSASDGELTALSSFNLTVMAVDDPPTLALTPAGPHIVSPGNPPLELALTVGDLDSPLEQLLLTAVSANQQIVPDAGLVLSGSGADRFLKVQPAPGALGAARISVRVSDGNTETTETFEVTVAPAEADFHISTVEDQIIEEDQTSASILFSIDSAYPLGGEVTLAVSSSDQELVPNSGIQVAFTGGAGSLRITPARDRSGRSAITISASSGPLAAVRSFDVTVKPVNDAPELQIGAAQPVTLRAGTTRVPLVLTDPDDSPESLSLAFGFNNRLIKTENVSVEGSGSERTLVIAHQLQDAGSASILITCTDGRASTSRVLKVQIPEPARISLAARRSGSSVALSWPSIAGSKYLLQSKASLGESWTDQGESMLAPGSIMEASVTIGASPCAFYRIVLLE